MIHYHGTPLTPRFELWKMAGKCLCVSFANPGDADWCLQFAQSVMWDNGGFSVWKQGIKIDWNKFYRWIEPRLGHPHWTIVPDVINGSVEDNLSLIDKWPHRKELSAVVWHMNEPIDHLLKLCDLGFAKICFGSTEQYDPVGSEDWRARTDLAFNELAKRGPLPWIHMLRGLAMAGDRWPFASADSVNVARNYKDSNICPERMALRIDAIQCPIEWKTRQISNGGDQCQGIFF